MPELPEIQALVEGLERELAGTTVTKAIAWQAASLKTPMAETALSGARIETIRRMGKVVIVSTDQAHVVIHLMSSGRLGLREVGEAKPGRQAGFSLELGSQRLLLREMGTKRRATVHLLDDQGLSEHPPTALLGPEPIGLSTDGWRNALTEPPGQLHSLLRRGRRIAGIGRCYANEIMWAARLAPFRRTDRMTPDEWTRLAEGADAVLTRALERARSRITTALPNKEERLTAAHQHYGDPCLRCGVDLQRVSFAEWEMVYCAPCQTDGTIYADRRMSRLLR